MESVRSYAQNRILALVELVDPDWAQIDYIRTPVSVFLQLGALLAVVGVGSTLSGAYYAPVLVGAVITLVEDSD